MSSVDKVIPVELSETLKKLPSITVTSRAPANEREKERHDMACNITTAEQALDALRLKRSLTRK